jgi:hypothetical protein
MNLITTIKKIALKSNDKSGGDWSVSLSSNEIITIDFQLKKNKVKIVDVETVEIEVDETRPWGCEFWWRIVGGGNVILIPNGAAGEDGLIEEIKSWGGFNEKEFELVTQATGNESYLIWSKF